jgi:hypothetical protein
VNSDSMRPRRARGTRRLALLLLLVCAALARYATAQGETAAPPTPAAPEAAPAAAVPSPAPDPSATLAAVADPMLTPLAASDRCARWRDMSVWGMFMDAGLVTRLVMILLIFASIWNVSILLEKSLTLRSVNRNADRFLETFRKSKSLEELSKHVQGKVEGPMPGMFAAGMTEFHLSVSSGRDATGDLGDRMGARVQDAMEISRTPPRTSSAS